MRRTTDQEYIQDPILAPRAQKEAPLSNILPLQIWIASGQIRLKETQCRYGYSISIRKCSSFVYSGCQGNENNFATLEECLKMCP
ncbi:Kunitz/Bovine pancreatic trypsin inhibitor domain protein [Cooperia oncophora]